MKINISFIYILSLITIYSLSSCQPEKTKNLKDYFVSMDSENINYKDFESDNAKTNQTIIFKQILDETDNGINITYYFMKNDSTKYLGGKEVIKQDAVNFEEQYIYMEDRKIVSDTIENNSWELNQNPQKELKIVFKDTVNKLRFENHTSANARYKDTLGSNTLIIESITKTVFLKYGLKYKENVGKSKRIYMLNKGLIYFDETFNDETIKYQLIESK